MVKLASSSSLAQFSTRHEANTTHVELSGVWTVNTLHLIEKTFQPNAFTTRPTLIFHLDAVSRFDTAAALLLNNTVAALKGLKITASIQSSNDHFTTLLRIAVLPAPDSLPQKPSQGIIAEFLTDLGFWVVDRLRSYGQQISFLGQFLATIGKMVLLPKRFRFTPLVSHMEQTGLKAIPIVCLLTFLIGMVVAYMGAQELSKFGAQVFAVNLLQVTVLREMGVLITAIVVAGRSSSSFTAQIGSMVANEEVAAIKSMGLSPMDLLVVPRVVALMFMLPVLVFVGDIAAIFGGAMALWYYMDLSLYGFMLQLKDVTPVSNFFVGMIKTPFFAIIIGIVGCYQGFKASTSAESVGLLTTISVVQAIFLVIVLDALFAIFFTALGI